MVGVGEGQGLARPGVAEQSRDAHVGEQRPSGQGEAEAPVAAHAQHLVAPGCLGHARPVHQRRTDESPALDLADQGREQPRQRRTVAQAAGGGVLDVVPGQLGRVVEADRRAAEGRTVGDRPPAEQLGGVGQPERVDERADRGTSGRADHRSDAVVLLVRQPQVQVEPPRRGDPVGEVLPHGLPGHRAHQTADDEPERHRVIAVPGAGRPPEPLALDALKNGVEGRRLVVADRRVERRQPGAVGQDERHVDLALPPLGEAGPVVGDRTLQVEQAAFDELERDRGGEGLADRGDRRDRVGRPGRCALPVAVAAPDCDDRTPMAVDTDARADLAPVPEPPGQQVGEAAIAVFPVTVHQARGRHWPKMAAVGASVSGADPPSDREAVRMPCGVPVSLAW